MKKQKKIILVIILMIVILLKPLIIKAVTVESNEMIRNPDRGFYKLVQIELQSNKEDFDDFESEINDIYENDIDVSIISFQLNLKNYIEKGKIPSNKIEDINKYFDIMRKYGYKVIYRVVYDSEGKKNPEPEFEVILQQIESLKDTYVKNRDIILVVEAGYLGSYGEWHDGKYDENKTKRNQIIDKLLQVIPQEIQINLRKPEFITNYLNSNDTVTSENAFSDEKIARLGLHNDGYLASKTDLGTYEEHERDESLSWQNKQTLFTIFGGESQKRESTYNDLNNAIMDMRNRHCTYLNKTYDREVKEKWKNTKYQGDDENYIGKNGYQYIQDHLGYRLILKNADITEDFITGNLNIRIEIENKGFGNIIKEKKLKILYKNDKEIFENESNIDIRKCEKNGIYSLEMEIQKPTDIEIGFYEFYLKIQEPYENIANNPYYQVKLANKNIWNNDINANYLGNFQITEKSKNVENNSNKKSNVPIFFKLVICLLIILVVILLIRKFK